MDLLSITDITQALCLAVKVLAIFREAEDATGHESYALRTINTEIRRVHEALQLFLANPLLAQSLQTQPLSIETRDNIEELSKALQAFTSILESLRLILEEMRHYQGRENRTRSAYIQINRARLGPIATSIRVERERVTDIIASLWSHPNFPGDLIGRSRFALRSGSWNWLEDSDDPPQAGGSYTWKPYTWQPQGEPGTNATVQTDKTRPEDRLSLCQGLSGWDKSPCTASYTEQDGTISQGSDSCTNSISSFKHSWNGQPIILVDTPGFNEDSKPLISVTVLTAMGCRTQKWDENGLGFQDGTTASSTVRLRSWICQEPVSRCVAVVIIFFSAVGATSTSMLGSFLRGQDKDPSMYLSLVCLSIFEPSTGMGESLPELQAPDIETGGIRISADTFPVLVIASVVAFTLPTTVYHYRHRRYEHQNPVIFIIAGAGALLGRLAGMTGTDVLLRVVPWCVLAALVLSSACAPWLAKRPLPQHSKAELGTWKEGAPEA